MSGEYREGADRDLDLFPWIEEGIVSLGVDPGARNTGVVITKAESPLFAETLVRNDSEDAFDYALRVMNEVREVNDEFHPEIIGVEKVTAPKGFPRGKSGAGASPINPGSLVMTGIVVGTVISMLSICESKYVLIHPRGNGSRNLSQYPPVLRGRRPKDLRGDSHGAGRGHEQSAFDIALKASGVIK